MTITTTANTTVAVALTAYIEVPELRVVRCYGVDDAGQYYLWITGEGTRSRAVAVPEGVGTKDRPVFPA